MLESRLQQLQQQASAPTSFPPGRCVCVWGVCAYTCMCGVCIHVVVYMCVGLLCVLSLAVWMDLVVGNKVLIGNKGVEG